MIGGLERISSYQCAGAAGRIAALRIASSQSS